MSFYRLSGALVGATIIVTIVAALLLVQEECRNASFYVSLGFVLLSEVFLFAGPHLVRTGGGRRMAAWHISIAVTPAGYAAGVAAITIMAIGGTPMRILLSAQLVWLLLFVIAVSVVRSAGDRMSRGDQENCGDRESFASVVSLLDDACDQCESLAGAEAASVLKELRRLREDVRYAAQDSRPEGISFDAKLSDSFQAICASLRDMEAGEDAGAGAEILRQIQGARQVIARREDAIAKARA